MMRSLLILTILMLCSFSGVLAQTKIAAVVLDEKGAPVPYATVYNVNSRRGVITNEEGRFEMDSQPGDVILIRCIGYQEYKNLAEQLQIAGVVILHESTFNIDEVIVTPNTNDAKSIVKKFHANIRRNYPRKATQINGVYKEYSLIDNEYSTFFQCDMDILINSVALYIRRPTFKTKVYDYKSFRHSDDYMRRWYIKPEYTYSLLGLFHYRFLWDSKKYQYRHVGYTTYNESKLAKIYFYPNKTEKSVKQYAGTIYIDMKTYALVFLHYEMLPNEMDFQIDEKGIQYKLLKEETKIMFEYYSGYYYPAYVIDKTTMLIDMPEGNVVPYFKSTVTVDVVCNFFTKNIEYNPKVFIEDGFSIDRLKSHRVLEQSDYKSNFVLETEQERQLMK